MRHGAAITITAAVAGGAIVSVDRGGKRRGRWRFLHRRHGCRLGTGVCVSSSSSSSVMHVWLDGLLGPASSEPETNAQTYAPSRLWTAFASASAG